MYAQFYRRSLNSQNRREIRKNDVNQTDRCTKNNVCVKGKIFQSKNVHDRVNNGSHWVETVVFKVKNIFFSTFPLPYGSYDVFTQIHLRCTLRSMFGLNRADLS